MTHPDNHAFSTRAVHAGERTPPGEYKPVSGPIQPSVGYIYKDMETLEAVFDLRQPGYVYPRHGSPSVAAFEAAVASLEAGPPGVEVQAHAFASGMAALHAALLAAGVRSGSAVVGALDLYGATFALLRGLLSELGAEVRFVDVSDLPAVEAALAETRPAAVLVETISNPLLKIAPLPALVELARRHQARLLVDNTFATPYLVNPLALGADFVVHSATKYLSGHGDVMAGVVACSSADRVRLYEIAKITGAILGPFEAWLALRGLKTLPLRVARQCASAQILAEWLERQPQVGRVIYPGLPSHPQHSQALALFQGGGCGGVLSFELAGAGQAQVFRFMDALKLVQPAATLGDVYSLVLHPATASHRALTPAERRRVGIADGLVRLSVGIEDPHDLIADLSQALQELQ